MCRSVTQQRLGTMTHNALRMHLPAHSAEFSRVVFQAKPHMAATKEVRSLAVRVSVRGGARRHTFVLPTESAVFTARMPSWRSFCIRTRFYSVSRRKTTPLRDRESTCAARRDPAQRFRGGAARGCQGKEAGRLVCRPSAYRQGALPPMRTVVCAGVPLAPPESPARGSARVPRDTLK